MKASDPIEHQKNMTKSPSQKSPSIENMNDYEIKQKNIDDDRDFIDRMKKQYLDENDSYDDDMMFKKQSPLKEPIMKADERYLEKV